MKIATFNINSINARLPSFAKWLEKTAPDVVLLQEIKTEYNNFPFFEISALGYHIAVSGQKGYNGVAVLSKTPIQICREKLPDFETPEARYIEVLISDILFVSVYMPNGNPLGSEKFDFKLKFMEAFNRHASDLLKTYQKIIIGGDFNVVLSAGDIYSEAALQNNALTDENARKALTAFKYLGYYDAFKSINAKENGYTYWDYGATAFLNDFGMRIDYFFLSAKIAESLTDCFTDKTMRMAEKPSDHAPLVATFEV